MKIYTYEQATGLISKDLNQSLIGIFSKVPHAPKIFVTPAPDEATILLDTWAHDGPDLNYIALAHFGDDTTRYRLLITAKRNSEFHHACINEVEHAHWGCSKGIIAIDYSSPEARLTTQLHELLHTFGVDDCYGPNGEVNIKCDNEDCLMRYGVLSTTVCSHVVNQLNAFFLHTN